MNFQLREAALKPSIAGGVIKMITNAPANKFVLHPNAPLYLGLLFCLGLLSSAHANDSASKTLQSLRSQYTALEILYDSRLKDIQNFEAAQAGKLRKADTDYYNSTLSFLKEAIDQNLDKQHRVLAELHHPRKNSKPPSTETPPTDAKARFYNLSR
jgi:hypothetical protein